MSNASVVFLSLAALLAAGGQLLFKIGANGKHQIAEFVNLPIAIGILLYASGMLIWIYVLSYEKLGSTYAFTALTFILVYVGAVFVIGEKLSTHGIVGIVLILAGLFLITSYNV